MTTLALAWLLLAQEPVPLTDLSDDTRELREAFERERGRVRLVMIVSPA